MWTAVAFKGGTILGFLIADCYGFKKPANGTDCQKPKNYPKATNFRLSWRVAQSGSFAG